MPLAEAAHVGGASALGCVSHLKIWRAWSALSPEGLMGHMGVSSLRPGVSNCPMVVKRTPDFFRQGAYPKM